MDVNAHLEKARAALKANSLSAATGELQKVLALDSNNVEAHIDLGTIAFFHGDCASAERDLHRAIQLAPTQTRAQALLAICEKRFNQPFAETMLEQAFASMQNDKLRTQVGVELADLYYQRRELDKTASMMHTLVELAPDNVDILFFAQRVYSELADATLNKLMVLAPESARMEQLIAERLINAGDAADAIGHYRKAISTNPDLPGMHFELAEAIMQASTNDPRARDDAKRELLAAMKVDGDSAKIEDELGQLAIQESDMTQALEYFRKAYSINPKDVDAAMGLARVSRMQEKPQEAADYLRLAVHEDPMSAEAHYQLAQACRQLHLSGEEQKELRLYHEVKDAKDKAKNLYREMSPKTAAGLSATPESRP